MAVNNKISKKGTFGTTMGVTSIIAILVILVLIVFSALSITTSNADLKLAEKTAKVSAEYYVADGIAEEKFAEVYVTIKSYNEWEESLRSKGYEIRKDGADPVVAYEVEINDKKSLFVELIVAKDGTNAELTRRLWQIKPVTDWSADTDVNLGVIP